MDSSGLTIVVLTTFGRVFKSSQGGAIGSFTELVNLNAKSYNLAVTPDLQRMIATSIEKCAMISTNGGATWRQLWTGIGNGCQAVALDATGQRALVGLYGYQRGGAAFFFSTEKGENLKEADGSSKGEYLSAVMDDTGTVAFVSSTNPGEDGIDKAVIGNGFSWASTAGSGLAPFSYDMTSAACSTNDRCMTLAVSSNGGLFVGKKQRHCMIADDPDCALTDESLAKPGDFFRFTRVTADIDAYGAYSTISTSASGHVAYTISARDHQIYVLSETDPKSLALPAKGSADRSEWRAVATNALLSNPGSSLDGLFHAACTSDGTVYASSSFRMWDDINGDIKAGSTCS